MTHACTTNLGKDCDRRGPGKIHQEGVPVSLELARLPGGHGFRRALRAPRRRASRWCWRPRPRTWGSSARHPRFQRSSTPRSTRPPAQADAEAVERLKKSLPPAQLRRFQALRDRCLALRQIADQLREPDGHRFAALARRASALRSRPPALDLPAHALHAAHARTVLREHQRRADPGRDPSPRRPNPPTGKGARISPTEPGSASRCKPTSRHATSRLSNLDEGPREPRACFRPRSKTWRRRSSRSPSWRSTAAMPPRSPARSSRSRQGLIRTEQTINDLGFATGVESFDLTVPTILSRKVAAPGEVEPEPPPHRRQRENEIRFL